MRAPPANASAPTLFGQGPRTGGLARSSVALSDPTDAPSENAALCAAPGFRLRLGYGYGALGLSIDGEDAGVSDVSGFELAAQIGASVTPAIDVGVALAAHVPDAWIARVSFRPATTPQFVLYEAALQRTTFDLVAALRYKALSIGGGVSMGVGVGGSGIGFELTQDAAGTRADAAADVELGYRAAPLVGVRVGLDRLSVGAAFRGASALDLRLESKSLVALTENPLNGVTTVQVSGASGYDPAAFDVGASVVLGAGFTVHAALEVALYSAAPPPVADVTIDVRLGTVPSLREARFVEPRFRDTLSPRVGVELRRPAEPRAPAGEAGAPAGEPVWRWALRAGYAIAPSPVPRQTGFTSYADATRHGLALGGGYRFGRALGVDLSANIAASLHLLAPRLEEKPSLSLPHARYEVGGHIGHGSVSLEAMWR
jgi:hypothetical protein